MGIGELIGFVGGAIGMVVAVPQARRLRTLGHGHGVSVPTWVLTFLVSVSWLGWGLRVASPSAVASNAVAAVLNGLVVATLLGRERRPVVLLTTLAVVSVALAQWLPMTVLSVILVGLTASRLPQVVHSWRTRHVPQESAVSISSLSIGAASMMCWQVYAVLEHHYLVNVTSTIALSLVAAIVWIEYTAPRTAAMQNR